MWLLSQNNDLAEISVNLTRTGHKQENFAGINQVHFDVVISTPSCSTRICKPFAMQDRFNYKKVPWNEPNKFTVDPPSPRAKQVVTTSKCQQPRHAGLAQDWPYTQMLNNPIDDEPLTWYLVMKYPRRPHTTIHDSLVLVDGEYTTYLLFSIIIKFSHQFFQHSFWIYYARTVE